jgi:predicted HAD superfamily Cof-like phosphohydrolase
MSVDWFKDMQEMHAKFGVQEWMWQKLHDGDKELLKKYMAFRLLMLNEELAETFSAALVQSDPEEVVDGIIDLCVFAIGTLEVFGVDAHRAWDRVLEANMAKEPGVKHGRPNPFNLPDLIKPSAWENPSHKGNHGILPDILGE